MKPSDFAPEPPTISTSLEARAAKLVANWRDCSEPQRKALERTAERLAKLPKVKK